jgi:hypothetical protein
LRCGVIVCYVPGRVILLLLLLLLLLLHKLVGSPMYTSGTTVAGQKSDACCPGGCTCVHMCTHVLGWPASTVFPAAAVKQLFLGECVGCMHWRSGTDEILYASTLEWVNSPMVECCYGIGEARWEGAVVCKVQAVIKTVKTVCCARCCGVNGLSEIDRIMMDL